MFKDTLGLPLAMKYDPIKYWNNRIHPNTDENPGIAIVERDIMLPLTQSAESILELGPGVGRLFPLYAGKSLSILDISTSYHEKLSEAANLLSIDLAIFSSSNPGDPFPFEGNLFDLGVAAHVLYHVPFELIEHTITELVRCCGKVLCTVLNDPSWPPKSENYPENYHVFSHHYIAIFGKLKIDYTLLHEAGAVRMFLLCN